jgi:hypothetical protein
MAGRQWLGDNDEMFDHAPAIISLQLSSRLTCVLNQNQMEPAWFGFDSWFGFGGG